MFSEIVFIQERKAEIILGARKERKKKVRHNEVANFMKAIETLGNRIAIFATCTF